MKIDKQTLDDVNNSIATLVNADGSFTFGTRHQLAEWLVDAGLPIRKRGSKYDQGDVYQAIHKLNKAGSKVTGDTSNRTKATPLQDGFRYKIVDVKDTMIGSKPVWRAIPLKDSLRYQNYEDAQRLFSRQRLNKKRADVILDPNKTSRADVDPTMLEVAKATSARSSLSMLAAEKIVQATGASFNTNDAQPLLSVSAPAERSYTALLRKLDDIDTSNGDYKMQ